MNRDTTTDTEPPPRPPPPGPPATDRARSRHAATEQRRPAGFTVLYDAGCPVCRRARNWAESKDQLVPLRFMKAGGRLARETFPDLDHAGTLVDITTIGDDGSIRHRDAAWITVLWSIASTRTLANDIAQGRKQRSFTAVVGVTERLRQAFRSDRQADCGNDTCQIAPTRPVDRWAPPGTEPSENDIRLHSFTDRDRPA